MKKHNHIVLTGRVSGEPVERTMPSGDKVVSFRLVVPRDEGGVDTIDCAVWSAALRRKVMNMADHEAHLSGQLRRRFWQTANGPASRYEVEAESLERVRR